MMFQFRHLNRLEYPSKHVLIVEDDLSAQAHLALHFSQVFAKQGRVQFSFVPGALQASYLIQAGLNGAIPISLIILDHDCPEGNAPDLIHWMKENNIEIPIITASGIEENNLHIQELCPKAYLFSKMEVFSGFADALIKKLL